MARAEVTRRLRSRLVGSESEFDPRTDFIVMSWSMFAAREFPYDEARKLALATGGLEVAELESAKLVSAKSGTVTITEPHQRLRREADSHLPGVSRERRSFPSLIDAVHTALYINLRGRPGSGPALARRAKPRPQRPIPRLPPGAAARSAPHQVVRRMECDRGRTVGSARHHRLPRP